MDIEKIIQYDPENDFEKLRKENETKMRFQAILDDDRRADLAD
jgi:hypothetical protein